MTRTDISNKTLELIQLTDFLILEHATGLGKTYQALQIINKYEGNWLIVFPHDPLVEAATVKMGPKNYELNQIVKFEKEGATGNG